MPLLMNVILTTTMSFSGTIATTSTSFETYDDLGCERTATLILGTGAELNQGVWYTNGVVAGKSIRREVICFPKGSAEKDIPMEPRGKHNG
jgi:hypothetical protein